LGKTTVKDRPMNTKSKTGKGSRRIRVRDIKPIKDAKGGSRPAAPNQGSDDGTGNGEGERIALNHSETLCCDCG
jgi:hypothetical protein